jgi:16S rRNA processing protein RimM
VKQSVRLLLLQKQHKLIVSWLEVGRITGLFGVAGWIKISSHTDPIENILNYQPWWVQIGKAPKQEIVIAQSEVHAKGIVVKCVGYDDINAARQLLGARIYVTREQLPALSDKQFYWTDLEGLTVETQEGVSLGKVVYLFATGANDVLVVKGDRERLIPYVLGQVIKHVDLSTGIIQVDWDSEF